MDTTKQDYAQNGAKAPTARSEGLLFEKGTKLVAQSVTSGLRALAVEKQSLTATPPPMPSEMTKAEALAILWTGAEELIKSKQAKLYRSRSTGRVVLELYQVDYDNANGLTDIIK